MQVGDPDSLDAIFVPVGGGGLIAGIAAYIKALKPGIKVCASPPNLHCLAGMVLAGWRNDTYPGAYLESLLRQSAPYQEQEPLRRIQITVCLPLLAQVFGVEPSGANAMAISLARGERVALAKVDAFADGVAVKQVSLAAGCFEGTRLLCCTWAASDGRQ